MMKESVKMSFTNRGNLIMFNIDIIIFEHILNYTQGLLNHNSSSTNTFDGSLCESLLIFFFYIPVFFLSFF